MEPILRCAGIAKRFGALTVLRQISFAVAPGEVVGLTAGHGGGKSVLVAILAGLAPPTEGEVYIDGQRLRGADRAQAAGVAVIYQEPELVERLDAVANIFLGAEAGRPGRSRLRWLDEEQMSRRAGEVLTQLGVGDVSLHEPVGNLPIEQRQLIAIARALLRPARLVILDEPTQQLGYLYQQKLLTVIRAWQQQGTAVLFSSGNLDHLFAVAGRILVLRQGRCVADLPTTTTSREDVVAALVGTPERQQLTPIIWALDSYYRARAEAEKLGRQQTLLEQNLAGQVEALDRANLALQDAHRRLLTEREAERKALARELHDQVIQDLLSVNYQLEELGVQRGADAHESAQGDWNEVRASIRALVDDVRRICSDLRPPTIDSLGLGAAVQSYTRDWVARTGIALALDLDPELGRLPESLELSVFRIVQEMLSNIRQHAGATAVQLALHRAGQQGALTIAIADNGHGLPMGFDLGALAAHGHYGMLGISERVALAEGRLHLQNRPGGGTLLQIEIPVPPPLAERTA